jgi:recombination protein RecA
MSKLSELANALNSGPGIIIDVPVPAIEEEPKKAKKEVKEAPKGTKEDKFKVLAELNKTLNSQFKVDVSLARLGKKVGLPIPSISTNLPSLDDDVLGCGGIPRGRIIEIYGPESSGKTTLALHIVACEQAATDNLAAYVDAEHAIDPSYAAKLGVNVDELLISQPDSGEQALETVDALIDSGAVSTIVVDSVAALVPQTELDGEMGDSNMGLQARLMSQGMRKLRGKAHLKGVTLIFINQIREKIGVMFGSPEVTTGGRALKFFATVRLDVRRKDVIGEKERPIGHVLKVKAVKNKVGSPMRDALVDLIYGKGFDTTKDLLLNAEKVGVVSKSGTWYSFNEERIGQGLTNASEYVNLNPELLKAIKNQYEKAKNGKD